MSRSISPIQTGKLLKKFRMVLAASLAAAGLTAAFAAPVARAADEDAGKPFVQKLEGTDISFKMVPIPAGTFSMGSPEGQPGAKPAEQPAHDIKVDPFFMEEHEVTWGEYNLFLHNYNRLSGKAYAPVPTDKMSDAVTYPTPMYDVEAGPALERMGGRTAEYPAVIMSQFAARQYCKWLSKKTGRFYRLPSEAEWEYAARAGTKTAYFFGDDASKLGDFAWYNKNSQESDGDTGYHKIMQKKPNPWGLYDIYGNVAEWCVDFYDPNWYKQFAGKTTDWQNAIDWPAPHKQQYPRALRGGGYDSDAVDCRSASRLGSNRLMNNTDPQLPKSEHWLSDGFFVGFRVVCPVKEPSEAEKLKWWEADDPTTEKTLQRDRERREIVKPGVVEK